MYNHLKVFLIKEVLTRKWVLELEQLKLRIPNYISRSKTNDLQKRRRNIIDINDMLLLSLIIVTELC